MFWVRLGVAVTWFGLRYDFILPHHPCLLSTKVLARMLYTSRESGPALFKDIFPCPPADERVLPFRLTAQILRAKTPYQVS